MIHSPVIAENGPVGQQGMDLGSKTFWATAAIGGVVAYLGYKAVMKHSRGNVEGFDENISRFQVFMNLFFMQ